jgi:K+-transporting ATPase KdpF subunit
MDARYLAAAIIALLLLVYLVFSLLRPEIFS